VATETAPQIAGSVAETALQAAASEEETSGQEEPSELEVNEDEIAEEVSEMMQTPENMEIPEEDQLQESWTEEEKEDFSQADQEDEMPEVRAQEQSADDYDVITADTIDLGKVVTDQTLAETVEHTVDAESVLPQISEPEDEEDFEAVTSLSEELRGIFTYFVSIKGMEEQICQALTGAARHLKTGKDASTGNMVIQGGSGSGKTVLATAMVKALQKETGRPKGKVGKIEASALNKKDVASLLKKISGGCLIIEKAGDISKETAVRLSLLLKSDTSGLFVIMEDTHRGIEKALGRDEGFASRFSEKINIPIFTSDELVSFAKAYANELGYTIDEMGILALYNSISNIQKYDRATTLTEVKEIVDDAISKSEKGGLRKAFSIITSRRYDDEDYVILREKDFGI
jgi:DNA replication protein DnaC